MRRPQIVGIAKPVFSAKWDGDRVWIEGLYGTALPLAGDLLLTADHVVANILAVTPELAVGWGDPVERYDLTGGRIPFSRVAIAARWPEVDMAALRLPATLPTRPAWDARILRTLTAVSSLGYPFGHDREQKTIMSRGFVGNIAGSRRYERFTANPDIYELSFAAPRGLSGGPVLHDDRICGSVVGNHQTKMLVFSDEERIEERGEVNRVERYESMNLGIAITARSILDLRLPDGSRLLDVVVAAGGEVLRD